MSGARFTSGCWYESVSFSADCPEKSPLKSFLLPALVKPVIAVGSRHLPAPPAVVGGVSLTSSLPSLLQAPPRGLSHALPSISWTKSLYGDFMAQRCSPTQTQTVAGGCRTRILHGKGRWGCGCSRGSSILHPAFQPHQTLCLLRMHQLLLTPFAPYLLLPARLSPSLSHDPRSVDGCMTPSGSVSPPRDRRGATPPELRAFLLADSRSDGIYVSLPQCSSTCVTCCHLVLVGTARVPPPG